MDEITEFQRKRAVNLIYNSARNYNFKPDFKAYDNEGIADIYWNTIIGAVRYHYNYSKLEPIFLSFQKYEESDTYEGLFWLALENCVYQKELINRPILKELRTDYAEKYIKCTTSDDILCQLEKAHYKRFLGLPLGIDKYMEVLLNELEFSEQMSTDDIVAKAKILFMHWFQIVTEEKKKNHHFIFKPLLGRQKSKQSKLVRKFGYGFADHPQDIYGGNSSFQQEDMRSPLSSMTDEELHTFMEGKFGKSIYTLTESALLEKELCNKNHIDCHLLITKGDKATSVIRNGFEALQKEHEAQQIKENRDYFYKNIINNHLAISTLTNKIRNSLLLFLEATNINTDSGYLNSKVVWKAIELNESKIFKKTKNDECGNLSVDILLDASTSQKDRLKTISTQGYIIAESLKNCNIPYRVMSFCSMTGYTILKIFTDYNENINENIFNFVANGCNRDGLAIRTVRYLMSQNSYDNKILIILSDVKPNDIRKIVSTSGKIIPYSDEAAILDTAHEVRCSKAENIKVMCVFTGEDSDIQSAKTVYGSDFTYLKSLDNFSNAVGKLLQNQIRNL